MKGCMILALAVSGACTASADLERTEQPVGAAVTIQEHFRGTEARATLSDQTTGVTIDVFENLSNTYPDDAFLFYQYGVADPSSYTCSNYCYYAVWNWDIGYGHIPTNDIAVTPYTAQLHTSTSVAGFTIQHCVFDQRDYSYICTDGVAGAIDVTWNRDGLFSNFGSGIGKQTVGAWTTQSDGTSWWVSAQATGSLVGHDFGTAYGTLNDTQTNQMLKTFSRN